MAIPYAEVKERLRQSLSIYEAYDDCWGIAMALDMLASRSSEKNNTLAERYARQSLELRRQIGDQWGMSQSWRALAWVAERQGRLQMAMQCYHESLKLRRDLRANLSGIVVCLSGIGRVAREMGDYDQAQRAYLENLSVARQMGGWYVAAALGRLGLVACEIKDYAGARRYLKEGMALLQDRNVKSVHAFLLQTLGDVALATGNYGEARRCFEQSLDLNASHSEAWLGLGQLFDVLGDKAAAYEHAYQALRCALKQCDSTVTLKMLVDIARLWHKDGASEQAIELLGLTLNHHALAYTERVQAERLLAHAATTLPAETIEVAQARGQAKEIRAMAHEILEQSSCFSQLTNQPARDRLKTKGE
jgi:tetratricopeptide (TPR) repeat protein